MRKVPETPEEVTNRFRDYSEVLWKEYTILYFDGIGVPKEYVLPIIEL